MALPLIAHFAYLGVACAITKVRPSTLIRVAEDGVVNLAQGAKRKVRSAKNKVSVEYNARMIDKLQRRVEADMSAIAEMTVEQRREVEKQQAAVFARANELRAKREAKEHPHASREGSSASV